jgi:hypothetical protein
LWQWRCREKGSSIKQYARQNQESLASKVKFFRRQTQENHHISRIKSKIIKTFHKEKNTKKKIWNYYKYISNTVLKNYCWNNIKQRWSNIGKQYTNLINHIKNEERKTVYPSIVKLTGEIFLDFIQSNK